MDIIKVAENGDINELTKLIEAKANIDIQDYDGDTALIYASRYRKFECTTKLISAKVNIDIQNSHGNTALILASFYGHIECIAKLIDAKANIDIQNKCGYTAIDKANTHETKDIFINYKKSQIIEEIVKVLPFPIALGHIYNWIAEYAR